jgi:hypothetical protein
VVECQLPKLDVAGSTPVSRSIGLSPGSTGASYFESLASSCRQAISLASRSARRLHSIEFCWPF